MDTSKLVDYSDSSLNAVQLAETSLGSTTKRAFSTRMDLLRQNEQVSSAMSYFDASEGYQAQASPANRPTGEAHGSNTAMIEEGIMHIQIVQEGEYSEMSDSDKEYTSFDDTRDNYSDTGEESRSPKKNVSFDQNSLHIEFLVMSETEDETRIVATINTAEEEEVKAPAYRPLPNKQPEEIPLAPLIGPTVKKPRKTFQGDENNRRLNQLKGLPVQPTADVSSSVPRRRGRGGGWRTDRLEMNRNMGDRYVYADDTLNTSSRDGVVRIMNPDRLQAALKKSDHEPPSIMLEYDEDSSQDPVFEKKRKEEKENDQKVRQQMKISQEAIRSRLVKTVIGKGIDKERSIVTARSPKKNNTKVIARPDLPKKPIWGKSEKEFTKGTRSDSPKKITAGTTITAREKTVTNRMIIAQSKEEAAKVVVKNDTGGKQIFTKQTDVTQSKEDAAKVMSQNSTGTKKIVTKEEEFKVVVKNDSGAKKIVTFLPNVAHSKVDTAKGTTQSVTGTKTIVTFLPNVAHSKVDTAKETTQSVSGTKKIVTFLPNVAHSKVDTAKGTTQSVTGTKKIVTFLPNVAHSKVDTAKGTTQSVTETNKMAPNQSSSAQSKQETAKVTTQNVTNQSSGAQSKAQAAKVSGQNVTGKKKNVSREKNVEKSKEKAGKITKQNEPVPVKGAGKITKQNEPVPVQGTGKITKQNEPVPVKGAGKITKPDEPVPVQGPGKTTKQYEPVPVKGAGKITKPDEPVPVQETGKTKQNEPLRVQSPSVQHPKTPSSVIEIRPETPAPPTPSTASTIRHIPPQQLQIIFSPSPMVSGTTFPPFPRHQSMVPAVVSPSGGISMILPAGAALPSTGAPILVSQNNALFLLTPTTPVQVSQGKASMATSKARQRPQSRGSGTRKPRPRKQAATPQMVSIVNPKVIGQPATTPVVIEPEKPYQPGESSRSKHPIRTVAKGFQSSPTSSATPLRRGKVDPNVICIDDDSMPGEENIVLTVENTNKPTHKETLMFKNTFSPTSSIVGTVTPLESGEAKFEGSSPTGPKETPTSLAIKAIMNGEKITENMIRSCKPKQTSDSARKSPFRHSLSDILPRGSKKNRSSSKSSPKVNLDESGSSGGKNKPKKVHDKETYDFTDDLDDDDIAETIIITNPATISTSCVSPNPVFMRKKQQRKSHSKSQSPSKKKSYSPAKTPQSAKSKSSTKPYSDPRASSKGKRRSKPPKRFSPDREPTPVREKSASKSHTPLGTKPTKTKVETVKNSPAIQIQSPVKRDYPKFTNFNHPDPNDTKKRVKVKYLTIRNEFIIQNVDLSKAKSNKAGTPKVEKENDRRSLSPKKTKAATVIQRALKFRSHSNRKSLDPKALRRVAELEKSSKSLRRRSEGTVFKETSANKTATKNDDSPKKTTFSTRMGSLKKAVKRLQRTPFTKIAPSPDDEKAKKPVESESGESAKRGRGRPRLSSIGRKGMKLLPSIKTRLGLNKKSWKPKGLEKLTASENDSSVKRSHPDVSSPSPPTKRRRDESSVAGSYKKLTPDGIKSSKSPAKTSPSKGSPMSAPSKSPDKSTRKTLRSPASVGRPTLAAVAARLQREKLRSKSGDSLAKDSGPPPPHPSSKSSTDLFTSKIVSRRRSSSTYSESSDVQFRQSRTDTRSVSTDSDKPLRDKRGKIPASDIRSKIGAVSSTSSSASSRFITIKSPPGVKVELKSPQNVANKKESSRKDSTPKSTAKGTPKKSSSIVADKKGESKSPEGRFVSRFQSPPSVTLTVSPKSMKRTIHQSTSSKQSIPVTKTKESTKTQASPSSQVSKPGKNSPQSAKKGVNVDLRAKKPAESTSVKKDVDKVESPLLRLMREARQNQDDSNDLSPSNGENRSRLSGTNKKAVSCKKAVVTRAKLTRIGATESDASLDETIDESDASISSEKRRRSSNLTKKATPQRKESSQTPTHGDKKSGSAQRLDFRVGDKLEAVDKNHPDYTCVASIVAVSYGKVRIHFDGWEKGYDFWCHPDSPQIHPVGWCEANGLALSPPRDWPNLDTFTWAEYLKKTNSNPVLLHCFLLKSKSNLRVTSLPRVREITQSSGQDNDLWIDKVEKRQDSCPAHMECVVELDRTIEHLVDSDSIDVATISLTVSQTGSGQGRRLKRPPTDYTNADLSTEEEGFSQAKRKAPGKSMDELSSQDSMGSSTAESGEPEGCPIITGVASITDEMFSSSKSMQVIGEIRCQAESEQDENAAPRKKYAAVSGSRALSSKLVDTKVSAVEKSRKENSKPTPTASNKAQRDKDKPSDGKVMTAVDIIAKKIGYMAESVESTEKPEEDDSVASTPMQEAGETIQEAVQETLQEMIQEIVQEQSNEEAFLDTTHTHTMKHSTDPSFGEEIIPESESAMDISSGAANECEESQKLETDYQIPLEEPMEVTTGDDHSALHSDSPSTVSNICSNRVETGRESVNNNSKPDDNSSDLTETDKEKGDKLGTPIAENTSDITQPEKEEMTNSDTLVAESTSDIIETDNVQVVKTDTLVPENISDKPETETEHANKIDALIAENTSDITEMEKDTVVPESTSDITKTVQEQEHAIDNPVAENTSDITENDQEQLVTSDTTIAEAIQSTSCETSEGTEKVAETNLHVTETDQEQPMNSDTPIVEAVQSTTGETSECTDTVQDSENISATNDDTSNQQESEPDPFLLDTNAAIEALAEISKSLNASISQQTSAAQKQDCTSSNASSVSDSEVPSGELAFGQSTDPEDMETHSEHPEGLDMHIEPSSTPEPSSSNAETPEKDSVVDQREDTIEKTKMADIFLSKFSSVVRSITQSKPAEKESEKPVETQGESSVDAADEFQGSPSKDANTTEDKNE